MSTTLALDPTHAALADQRPIHPARPIGPSPQESSLRLRDGCEILYRAWIPNAPTRRSLVIFHRGHEHSGRLEDVVAELALQDTAVFAWDARGHGRSSGRRGHAPSFASYVRDADAFVRHLAQTYDTPIEEMAVLGHSVGGVIAAAWVHDFAPRIRALVLAAPAFRVRLWVPFALPALGLAQRLRGKNPLTLRSYVRGSMLTRDSRQAQSYDRDPLVSRDISVPVLLGLHRTARRVVEDAAAIRIPTLVLTGGSDHVVQRGPQERFFDRLSSPHKRFQTLPGMRHDLLHEKDRDRVFEEIERFLAETERAPRPEPLLDADRAFDSPSRVELESLQRPLPATSPKSLAFAAMRLGLDTVGRLSEGIRLGHESGFDSGRSLDYVYRNEARGMGALGRAIDRWYLDSPGWRGIRERKLALMLQIWNAIDRLRREAKPVRLLDVAAGPGRYLLEILAAEKHARGTEVSAHLRDLTPANLEQGRRMADEMGLERVSFELGNAFDGVELSRLEPAPTVAVVSGLYELFPDNPQVLASLRGLAGAMEEGGYLVYTGQPWHPQLKVIARVLRNRDGQPWLMRRRSQEEMDDLVAAAGFEKLAMEIDEQGIFTVSLARRRETTA